MNIPYFTLFAFIMILFTSCNDSENKKNKSSSDIKILETEIRGIIDGSEGEYAVAFIEVGHPSRQLFINADKWFHAASTMKTPVILKLHQLALDGKLSLDDPVLIKNEFKSIKDGSLFTLNIERDGAEALYEHLGSTKTIRELQWYMIVKSGNLATNLLIDRAGPDNVNQYMKEIGAEGILVRRGVEDMPAYNAGLNNETTARGLAVMYQRLAEGSILDETSRNEIISILKEQFYRETIPAGLPNEVEVAHKTGWITGISHDSGIVYLPDGRKYVLVILAKDLPEHSVGHRTGAQISRKIYDFLNP